MSDNPLLSIAHPIRFDQIRAEHVQPAVDQLLAESRERLTALEKSDVPLTYDTTLAALEDATYALERAMTVVGHLESVATTPELRAAYNAVQPQVSALLSSIPMSAGLFRMLDGYAQTDEARRLDPTRARFLSKTIDWFKREGAALSDADKARLEKLNVELTEITTRFSQNVLDSTNTFELIVEDKKQLAGLPERAISAARASAEQKGRSGYRFTLQAPSYMPLVTYLDDASIREQVYRAMNTRATQAPHDNRELVARILELRREKASLLGHKDFVDLVLHDRMAKQGERAHAFVADLEARTRAAFEQENAELRAFAGRDLNPWDVPYYSEKQRLARYAFDEEELRPYFPLERVLSGLFEIVTRLYGIVVDEVHDLPVWHDSVRAFRVRDSDGSLIGYFYADFFPREAKRDGAWMNAFLTSEPHVGLICANVTPPVGDTPALLGHREVETVFHEFGHLMHHMLTRVSVRSLAGTNVAWDFVELPSQIMENFCWEREALDLFARHYQTGERIPDALWEKMRRARTYRGGNDMMRQLGFAMLDLELHRSYQPQRDGAVTEFARQLMSRFAPAPLPERYAMVLGFGHLFAHPVGYAGGYYSYKWAEVLDADAFGRFAREGVFSRDVGRAFRDRILAQGDSRDPMDLFKDFMGREPDLRALLARSGIEAA
ncbi:MAG TPA: M3 family metallopeptidase [Polyangiales bacterium]|nr:M3 family metallopeptidase [Polyangiales bacterium]